jgi:phytol kinase
MLNPWLGIVLVSATLIRAMVALKCYSGRCHVAPELLRKGLHMGMGVVTLLFPWLFSACGRSHSGIRLSVVAVVASMVPSFAAIRGRRNRWRVAAHLRRTLFPVAIALVFWLSRGNVLLYSIPVLVLTFADALAAVVGIRYGAHRYRVGQSIKSWEGSATFFVVTYFAVFFPLMPVEAGSGKAFLIAIATALPVTFVEAVSHSGWDNLSVPLSTLLILAMLL